MGRGFKVEFVARTGAGDAADMAHVRLGLINAPLKKEGSCCT
jgi:hypothetical protein